MCTSSTCPTQIICTSSSNAISNIPNQACMQACICKHCRHATHASSEGSTQALRVPKAFQHRGKPLADPRPCASMWSAGSTCSSSSCAVPRGSCWHIAVNACMQQSRGRGSGQRMQCHDLHHAYAVHARCAMLSHLSHEHLRSHVNCCMLEPCT